MARRISSQTLIGRQSELDALLSGIARTPSVFLVTGEAGIGKSRLVDELARRATGVRVLRGQCVDFAGAELPYAPLAEAIRDATSEVVAAAAQTLPAGVRAQLGLLVPALTTDALADASPIAGADARMLEHLRAFLRAVTRVEPVLLIVEDVHWADQSTRDFLLYLARTVRDERLTVVISHRRDRDGGSSLPALRLCPAVETIELEPLPQADIARQIEAILNQPVDASILRRISERSQGNPFYVEELLATPDGLAGRLPAALSSALLTRVEGLTAETRRLLDVLSAFGRPVSEDLLAAAAAIREPRFSRCLRAAADAYLISEHAHGTLGFRHALTREAVYGALLPGERRQLHTAVAQALEGGDTAELARHWLEAGAAEPAVEACLLAGAAAMELYAFAQARAHYETALAWWARAGRSADAAADVWALAARAAACEGDQQRALEHTRAGLASLGPDPAPAAAARFHEQLGRYEKWDLDGSLARYREALRLLPPEPSAARARLLADEAMALMFMVRWDEARAGCDQALAAAAAADARAEEGYARANLGLLLACLGEFTAAEAHLLTARQIAEELRRPEDVARAYLNHGEALRLSGDVAAALEVMRRGEALAEELGVTASYGRFISISAAADEFDLGEWEAAARRLAGIDEASLVASEQLLFDAVAARLAAARGEFVAAAQRLDGVLDGLDESVPTELVAYIGAVATEVAVLHGDPVEARGLLDVALRKIGPRQDRQYTAWLLSAGVRAEADLAELAHGRLAKETAIARAAELLAALEQRLTRAGEGPAPVAALAHLALARAELARAQGDAAPGRWGEAVAAWDALAQPYLATYARVRWARSLLVEAGRRPAAAALLDEARAFSEPRGAQSLSAAIDELARHARLTSQRFVREVDAAPEPWRAFGLTSREVEVLKLLELGITNEEIGARLFISHRTVGVHVSRILTKLDVPNRTLAAVTARRLGIVGEALSRPA